MVIPKVLRSIWYLAGYLQYSLLLLSVSRPAPNYTSFTWMLITVVMILRVYAMWNQSKIILGVLLFICVPQNIYAIVMAGLYGLSSGEFLAKPEVLMS